MKCVAISHPWVFFSYAGDPVTHQFDYTTNTPVAKFEGHSDEVTCIHVTKNTIYIGSADKTIQVYDLQNGEYVTTLYGHTGAVTSILYHECVEKNAQNLEKTLKLLFTGSTDTTVRVYNNYVFYSSSLSNQLGI